MNAGQLAELDAVIAILKEHPERHDQGYWVKFEGSQPPVLTPELDCGSAFCIAGAVAIRNGAKPVEWEPRYDWSEYRYGETTPRVPIAFTLDRITTPAGVLMNVGTYARLVLGITSGEADVLFAAYNTMEDIERYRDYLANGVPVDEWDLHED